jgi:hypothetical protein
MEPGGGGGGGPYVVLSFIQLKVQESFLTRLYKPHVENKGEINGKKNSLAEI